jgi:hypothetical protein
LLVMLPKAATFLRDRFSAAQNSASMLEL